MLKWFQCTTLPSISKFACLNKTGYEEILHKRGAENGVCDELLHFDIFLGDASRPPPFKILHHL